MKQTLILFVTLCTLNISAQFKTGNIELNKDIITINARGLADFKQFKKDLTKSYPITEKKIDFMRNMMRLWPGDIFLTLEVTKLSGKSREKVLSYFVKNKKKGWSYICSKVSMRPGSSKFKKLVTRARAFKNKKENSKFLDHKQKIHHKGKGHKKNKKNI